MPANETYRSLSYWLDSVPGPLAPADPLPGDLDADVAIVGAGLTGLWTAYYLAGAQPGLRVAVCEAKFNANCGEPEVAVSPRVGRKMDCTCAAAYGVTSRNIHAVVHYHTWWPDPAAPTATRRPVAAYRPRPRWDPARSRKARLTWAQVQAIRAVTRVLHGRA